MRRNTLDRRPQLRDKGGMSRPWKNLGQQLLLQTRVFAVRAWQRQSPETAKSHDFWVIEPPDWVNIVALTTAGELVLVEQWRHGTGAVTVEIPGGMIDPGETPEVAARRELLEETGYAAQTLTWIGCVEPNPAIQSNRCTTFLALGCERVAETHFDSTEECVLRLEPMDGVADLVRSGVIDHALVVAALQFAFLRGALPMSPRQPEG